MHLKTGYQNIEQTGLNTSIKWNPQDYQKKFLNRPTSLLEEEMWVAPRTDDMRPEQATRLKSLTG